MGAKEIVLYVRMDEELDKRLRDYAKKRTLTVSAAARMLIKLGLDREDTHDEPQPPPPTV